MAGGRNKPIPNPSRRGVLAVALVRRRLALWGSESHCNWSRYHRPAGNRGVRASARSK